MGLAWFGLVLLWGRIREALERNLPVKTARQRVVMSILTTEKCGMILAALLAGVLFGSLVDIAAILLGVGGREIPVFLRWICSIVGSLLMARFAFEIMVKEEEAEDKKGPWAAQRAAKQQAEARQWQITEAHYKSGRIHHNKGEYGLAIRDYTEAISLNPGYANAWHGRALAYEANGEHDKASADYTEVRRLSPGDERVL